MPIELRPFTPEDIRAVPLNKFGHVAFSNLGHVAVERLAEAYRGGGPAWTAFHDGELLACAGVFVWSMEHTQRTGEAWALVNHELAQRCPVLLTRTTRRVLDAIQRDWNVVRINALVHGEYRNSQRWVQVLGFQLEAHLPKWINGNDYLLYGRVR